MSDTEDDRPARGDGTAPSWRGVLDDPPVPVGEWTVLDSVKLGVVVGLLLAAVGVGTGILLIAQRIRMDCTGVDGGCLAPQGLEGTAVVVISLMLAILIWLTGRVAKAALRVEARR